MKGAIHKGYFGLLQAKINSSVRVWQIPHPSFGADVLHG